MCASASPYTQSNWNVFSLTPFHALLVIEQCIVLNSPPSEFQVNQSLKNLLITSTITFLNFWPCWDFVFSDSVSCDAVMEHAHYLRTVLPVSFWENRGRKIKKTKRKKFHHHQSETHWNQPPIVAWHVTELLKSEISSCMYVKKNSGDKKKNWKDALISQKRFETNNPVINYRLWLYIEVKWSPQYEGVRNCHTFHFC